MFLSHFPRITQPKNQVPGPKSVSCSPLTDGQTDTHESVKSVKMQISKNKNMCIFLMSQVSPNPKIRFLSQKVCPVARSQTDRHTDRVTTEGHPFRVSCFFPSAYHQGSAQNAFLSHVSRIIQPPKKIGSQVKRCALQPANRQIHRHTHIHESEYRGHPFRVSGIFPSTYHQGSIQ